MPFFSDGGRWRHGKTTDTADWRQNWDGSWAKKGWTTGVGTSYPNRGPSYNQTSWHRQQEIRNEKTIAKLPDESFINLATILRTWATTSA